jgi:hypothetical protein
MLEYLNTRICQQRSTLAVLANNLATLEGLFAENTRNTDGKGDKEEECHDGESFDPLGRDDDCKELGNTKG